MLSPNLLCPSILTFLFVFPVRFLLLLCFSCLPMGWFFPNRLGDCCSLRFVQALVLCALAAFPLFIYTRISSPDWAYSCVHTFCRKHATSSNQGLCESRISDGSLNWLFTWHESTLTRTDKPSRKNTTGIQPFSTSTALNPLPPTLSLLSSTSSRPSPTSFTARLVVRRRCLNLPLYPVSKLPNPH
ncbi:hypothetical protein BDN72DRAFT_225545 [Pluteus cervinus]|uniref:Uncharacterized protein n=1 Tax=Pluteus cervinus TaxID=181527 RepID=A0ACD3BER6_9AGAR|nr:hypothetical protein BDN72DRAFT_225545 [Pluteus cervinus]